MEGQEQYARLFDHFDSNKDGKICPVELRRCVGSLGSCDMSPEDAEIAVALMDSDSDGFLCLDDFVRLVEGVDEEEKVRDLKEAFKMYVMEEGTECVITPRSLKRMLSRLGERKSVDECRDMIDSYDLNGDGVLNFDEFKVMMC